MKKMIVFLIILTGILPLIGASVRESDDYAYIVELYDAGEYQDCLFEIEYFNIHYPESEFLPYLDYIRANIALSRQDNIQAQAIFEQLVDKPLQTDILADVHLKYAISLYQTRSYNHAASLLSTLSLFSKNPYYTHKSNEWLGRVFAAQDNYLSAKHEYEKALADSTGDMGVAEEYFQLLLDMDEDELAEAYMQESRDNKPLYCRFMNAWMEYLLYNQRFEDIDALYPEADSLCVDKQDDIDMIMVRRYIGDGNYASASSYLDNVQGSSAYRDYYRALIKLEQGMVEQADTLFQHLVRGNVPEIQFLSYLQRLKIIYASDPDAAVQALQDYIKAADHEYYKGEQHFMLGYFLYGRERYTEALLQFTKAMGYDLPVQLRDQAENYISESYFLIGELRLARERYNRYLNLYPYGRYRDKALYQIGVISFNEPDLALAKSSFEMLDILYPQSDYARKAQFYLGEISFLSSDPEHAIQRFRSVPGDDRNFQDSLRRLAQCYILLDRYVEADSLLKSVPLPNRGFDWQILDATRLFNTRVYDLALAGFTNAESIAKTSQEKVEAASYQAYTLYYLKRFDDASALFARVSDLAPGNESYLYQAARSAYQGRSFSRALELYDRFIDEYPDSPHFLPVLVEVAYCYYNLGLYQESYQDWLNILQRFTAHPYLEESDLALVKEAINGLELTCRYLDSQMVVDNVLELLTLFQSDYIKFELQYLVVRLYADAGEWQALIDEAEAIRQAYPDMKRNEIELLMAESLLKLNEASEADSLVTNLYEETKSVESLIKLAEMAAATGDASSSLQYYTDAFGRNSSPDVWLAMLDVSIQNGYLDFDNVWDLGKEYADSYPLARLQRMKYLISMGFRAEAGAMANRILDVELNQYYRAQAEFTLAFIQYEEGDYTRAVQAFKRVRMLYREYPDVFGDANYYYILSLIQSGSLKEAQLTLWDVQNTLTDDQIININDLLDSKR